MRASPRARPNVSTVRRPVLATARGGGGGGFRLDEDRGAGVGDLVRGFERSLRGGSGIGRLLCLDRDGIGCGLRDLGRRLQRVNAADDLVDSRGCRVVCRARGRVDDLLRRRVGDIRFVDCSKSAIECGCRGIGRGNDVVRQFSGPLADAATGARKVAYCARPKEPDRVALRRREPAAPAA